MAIYRPVYTSFWQDDFILSIPFAERYFYIYLMTNTKTSLCGIYELPRSIASIETGLSIDKIKDLLNKFQNKYHRVVCSEKTNEIVITNWLKYNNNISPHFQEALTKSFKEVKDTELIRYVYGIEKTRYGMYTVGLQPVSVSDTVINTNTIINGTFKDNDLNTELNTKNTDKQEENLQVSKLDKKSIIEKWNEIDEIAHIDCIEHKRLDHVKARIEEKGFDKFMQMIENVKVSPFILGKIKSKDGKAFKATFDWCILPNNFQKVLDGNYIESSKTESAEEIIERRANAVGRKIGSGY